MTTVKLYEDAGFGGGSYTFKTSDANLTNNLVGLKHPFNWNWDNEASSLEIKGGPVTFYEHDHYQGAHWTLPAGKYDLGQMQDHGIPNDMISSFLFA